jgi:hypothetical protein
MQTYIIKARTRANSFLLTTGHMMKAEAVFVLEMAMTSLFSFIPLASLLAERKEPLMRRFLTTSGKKIVSFAGVPFVLMLASNALST